MNTTEVIAALRQADPSGTREVWLEISNGERASHNRRYTDTAGEVLVDAAGDVVITGETV